MPHFPCGVCLLLVLAPQLYWLAAMVRGAMKVLEDRKIAEKEEAAAMAGRQNGRPTSAVANGALAKEKNGKIH